MKVTLSEVIFPTIILHSSSGKLIPKKPVSKLTKTKEYKPTKKTKKECTKVLESLGFKVIYEGIFSLTVSTTKSNFEKTFTTKVIAKKYKPIYGKSEKVKIERIYYQLAKEVKIPNSLKGLVQAVTFPPPVYFLESGTPPDPTYYHLDVPEDIRNKLNVHGTLQFPYRRVLDGRGVVVAMLDTGFYQHQYFTDRGLTANVHGDSPRDDSFGHGTSMAANLFAVAPGVQLEMIKTDLTGLEYDVNISFQKALSTNPNIICCCFGTDYDWHLQILICEAIGKGITVVAGCGNKDSTDDNKPVFPGDNPLVISVGGAYPLLSGFLWKASSYALSGKSRYYTYRTAPDVCGIVGQEPDGILIMLPTQPGPAELDLETLLEFLEDGVEDLGGDWYFSYILNDGTRTDDGWACLSGTSSATAQVTGVIALILQICPQLQPDQVKKILMTTATDVTRGVSASGDKAHIGNDVATGSGVVNARKAIDKAILMRS